MLRALLVATGLSLLSAAAVAGQAGKVVFAIGKAQVSAKPAAVDQAIEEGDELSTGSDGYIYMKTVDDGFLILRPNSKARVIAYKIDAANPANTQVKLELLSGVARSISGDGVKRARHNFRFNTPVAAIGVRGTDFIVYTNQQSSWVSVVSGGVVMSSFAGACGPEGTGPCEGVTSRELFAGRADAMLQLQRGEQAPQLMQGATVAPELNAPARGDEPVGKVVTGATSGAAPLTEVNLDAAKTIPPLTNAPTTQPPPVVIPTPDLPAPVPAVPETPFVQNEIMWGRWKTVAAGMPVDAALVAKIEAEGKKVQIRYGNYVIARPDNSAFVMPREGTASFALTGGEATLTKLGGEALPARIENASLNIDFAAQSYSTGLSVINSLGQVDVRSKGDVTRNGLMENSLLSQGVFLRGMLGGTNASEAVYTFKSNGDAQLSAAGITTWSRK